MHTPDAYAALIRELEALRQLPLPELLALLGSPPTQRVVDVSGEQVEVELVVTWRDKKCSEVLVTAHARGPSTWHTQHLQERITVPARPNSANDA